MGIVKVTSLVFKAGSGFGFSFGVRAWTEMKIRCIKGMYRLKLVSSKKKIQGLKNAFLPSLKIRFQIGSTRIIMGPLSFFVILVHYVYTVCLLYKLHQELSKAASSQATSQLDEVMKERNHLEQKTIAQQAKIESTIQVYSPCAIMRHF